MNILMFFPSFPSIGGTEGVMTYMANGFVMSNHNVIICSCNQSIDGKQPCLNEKVKCLLLPSCDIASKENVKSLITYIRIYKIELIINHFSLFGGVKLCSIVKRKTNIKLITIHHGNIYPLDINYLIENMPDYRKTIYRKIRPLYRIYKNAMMYCLHWYNIIHSDRYVLLAKSYLHHFYGCKRVVYINNAIMSDWVDESANLKKENVVLFVGRLIESQKRVTLALYIWKKIAACFPDWKFIIVGDGNDRNIIDKYIYDNEIKNVQMVGFQDPDSYYRLAKVLLVTSSYEGWGLVINEAKLNRCVPMAFMTYECLPELINDGKDGFIIKEGNIKDYSDKLKYLMQNEDERIYMAEEAFKSCAKFSQEAILEKWNILISDLLNKK